MSLPRRAGGRWLVMLTGFALSGVALYIFLRRVDGQELWTSFASANLWILSICLLTKGVVLALNATRTRILLLPIRRYSFVDTFVPWLTGYVTDNLLPFRLGELVRIDLLARAGRISRGSTVAVVALDRLLDLMSLLVLLGFAVPLLAIDLSGDQRLFFVVAIVGISVMAALWLSARPSRVMRLAAVISRPFGVRTRAWLHEKAERFSEGLGALRSGSMVFAVVGVTFLTRLVGLATIQCWLWAFDLNVPLYTPVVVLLFISVGTMIPSSPGFVGTFHVACAYALELMGVEPAVAASVAIAGHFMATVPWTVIGLSVALPSIRRFWSEERQSLVPSDHIARAQP